MTVISLMPFHCSQNGERRPDRWRITGVVTGLSNLARWLITLAIVWLDYLCVNSCITLIVYSHMVQGRQLGTVSFYIKKWFGFTSYLPIFDLYLRLLEAMLPIHWTEFGILWGKLKYVNDRFGSKSTSPARFGQSSNKKEKEKKYRDGYVKRRWGREG